jgi:membrane protein implicated in regulation of membrane protease activity
MKAFVTYTLARLAMLAATYAVVWVVVGFIFEKSQIINVWMLLIAFVVSSVLSLLFLGKLRDDFARSIQARAEAINERIEESRRAEDVD